MRGAFGADNIRMLRIAAVMQDMLLFVLPAVIVAVLLTRLPARFLAVDSRPRWRAVCLAALTMIVSIPAMNWVIEANASLPLPEGIAASLRQLEETAARTTEAMLGGTDIGSLVMNLLIIAVLAGFSEELFFRGMVQRLLSAAAGTPGGDMGGCGAVQRHAHAGLRICAAPASGRILRLSAAMERLAVAADSDARAQ